MKWWVSGAVLLALVVGAAGGYAVATSEDDPEPPGRRSFAEPLPVPAADPSLPVLQVEPDPADPPLADDIALKDETLVPLAVDGKPSRLRLRLPVPTIWTRTYVAPAKPGDPARWQFTMPGNDAKSYGLRVDIYLGEPITMDRAIGARRAQLDSARANGDFVDLDYDEVTDAGFLASYVQGGYRRFSLERFFSGPDPAFAYATVTVFGREKDLPGMHALMEYISIDLRTG